MQNAAYYIDLCKAYRISAFTLCNDKIFILLR